MKKQPTAIVYARVSTSRQADEGLPIESQIEQSKAKVESLGAKLLQVFHDDGISGRTAKRPAFQAAVDFCADHEVDYFVVWSTSRFARNKLDAAAFKQTLKKLGTRVVYVSCEIDSATDEGWFSESIFEIVDEHYSRVISKDTKRSMMKNARDGYYNGGVAPFGYRIVQDGKRKRLEINPEEAGIVVDMFSMYLGGSGVKEITTRLNGQNISRRGAKWDKNTVTNLLKNMVYTGHIVFNKRDRVAGGIRPQAEWIIVPSHAAIISEEVFERVQAIFRERTPQRGKGSPHSKFPFSGMLKCGSCGAGLHVESANGRSKTYHYYNCRAALRGIRCSVRRIKAQELDAWLIDTILETLFTPERMAELLRDVKELTGSWEKSRTAQLERLEKELRSTEAKLDNLFGILEETGKDTPNLGDLTTRLRMHKANKERIDKEILTINAQTGPEIEISQAEVEEYTEMFRGFILNTEDVKKQRLFFSTFIKQIVIHDDCVKIDYHPERLVNRKGFTLVQGKGPGWLPDLVLPRTATITAFLPERMRRVA